ncbi:MAG: right-handed parallel beta-helix repeat-containing protein [Myxococcota bacterium]|jgi:hypothetical protein|nr:right-handed parallel beta-helix repeat-containing protein [Myxococcota bacterium]
MDKRFQFLVVGLIFFSGCKGGFSPGGFDLTVCEADCLAGEVCTQNGCRELCQGEGEGGPCSQVGFVCSNENICEPVSIELKPFIETIDGDSIHLSGDDLAVGAEESAAEHRVATGLVLRGRNLANAKVELLDEALNLHELNTDAASDAGQLIAQLPENLAAGRYLLMVYNEFGVVENSVTILQGESGLMGPVGPEGLMGPMPEIAADGFFVGTGENHSPLALNMDKVADGIADLGFVKPGTDGLLNSVLLPQSTVQTTNEGFLLGDGSTQAPLKMDIDALAASLPSNIPEALVRLDSSGMIPEALLLEQPINLSEQGLLVGDGTTSMPLSMDVDALAASLPSNIPEALVRLDSSGMIPEALLLEQPINLSEQGLLVGDGTTTAPLGLDVDGLAAALPANMVGGLVRLTDLNHIPEAFLPYSAIGNYSDARYLSLEHVISDEVVIPVGLSSDAMFASIPEALDFLGDKIITSKGLVRIQVEPGYYEHNEPIHFIHDNGARIEIIGVPNNPDAVTLYFDGVSGLGMSSGTTLKLFVGFKLQGDGETGTGIYAAANARLTLGSNESGNGPGVKVSGFTHGVYADHGSYIYAPYVDSSYNGNSGFLAYRNASISAAGARAEYNGTYGFISGWGGFLYAVGAQASYNGNSGFYAVYQSILHATGAKASFCGHSGFRARENSHVYAGNNTEAKSNDKYGVYAQHSSYIHLGTCIVTGNGTADIAAYHGSRISSSTATANIWSLDGVGGSSAQNVLSSRGSYIVH